MHNIALIGYRCTGKTTVARALAARLGWEWIDSDVELEHRAGKSIAEMFQQDGEPAFRDLECRVTADLCKRKRTIIAMGGGAPMRVENRDAMAAGARVVWLKADVPTIYDRMTADPTTSGRRPDLTRAGGEAEIVELLQQRTPIYRQCADLEIDTESKTPDDVADEIITQLDLSSNSTDTA